MRAFSAFVAVVVVALICPHVDAITGVDVSNPLTTTVVNCLKNAKYTHVISRCYHSSGTVDSGAKTSYTIATAAGMEFDVYHFPDVSQGAEAQITTSVNYLHSNNVKWGRYWLDVEPFHWGTNKTKNVEFVHGLVKRLTDMGVTNIGFYTSKSAWDVIMGTNSDFHQFPLWYPHYQKPAQENFNDFVTFGGWTKPYMKQFAGDVTVCNADLDENWRP